MSGLVATPALALVLLLQAAPAARPVPRDSWWSADKAKHFLVGAWVQGMGYGTLRAVGAPHGPSLGGATFAAVGVSVGKELRDRRAYGLFSVRDLVWGVAGAGAMSLLLRRTAR